MEWKLTFSSPVAAAQFSKFAGILSAALSQHHLLGFIQHTHVQLSVDPVVYSPPGPSVHGIFWARILKWIAISSSRDLQDPEIKPMSPALTGGFFTTAPPGQVLNK